MPKLPTPRNRREPKPIVTDKAQLWDWMTSWIPATGHVGLKPVNEGTVYGVPAAWRCATFIANAVASCGPPVVHAPPSDANMHDANKPVGVTPHVAATPWPMLTGQEYWSAVVLSLLLYGNFYGVPADLDPDTGYPRQVIPVHPSLMEFSIERGRPHYKLGELEWEYGEIVHVRGHLAAGQLKGMGVIERHRVGFSEAVDHQQYGMNIYGGAAVPPWVVGVDQPEMSEEQAEKLQQRMATVREQGSKLPAVIPSTMSIETLAFSPADAQFLEAKRWSATEVAWMFGMDPADLGVAMPGASLTYANIGERSVERLTHTVGPWIRRLEQTWSAFLLPGGQHMHFDTDNLMRTDPETLMDNCSQGYEAGLYTYNECRVKLGLHLICEPWADEPFGKPPGQTPAAFGLPDPTTDPEMGGDDDDDAGADDATA